LLHLSVLEILILLLHVGAGWMVFIHLLNRMMNRMRGSLLKFAAQLALLLAFTIFPLAIGWWVLQITVGSSSSGVLIWRWVFPLLVGLIWAVGEVMLYRSRIVHKGFPPTSSAPLPRKGINFLRHPFTTLDLTTHTYNLPWDGPDLTLVHLTDLHLNEVLPLEYYHQAISTSNDADPDLVFLSGDFVTHAHEIPLLPSLLSHLHTTDRLCAEGIKPGKAVLASLGNHDYWSDPGAIRQVIHNLNIPLLSGRCLEMHCSNGQFRVCGDDRPWGQGLDEIVEPGKGLPTLVLSHSPDNIYQLIRLSTCRAVFSGHVHAGQFRIPLPWSGASSSLVLPSAYGRRLDHGHFIFERYHEDPVHLFVSAGIGAAEPPLRLYCPPEILMIRFLNSKKP
jgi:predicted MPP superfamily phosphohydrolase